MNVKAILAEYLKSHGYDGLCGDDCGCSLEKFMPCGELSPFCVVAMKGPCKCGGGHDFDMRPVEWLMGTDTDKYICECGEVCRPSSGDWRWNGSTWEHFHGYPIGHVPVQKKE